MAAPGNLLRVNGQATSTIDVSDRGLAYGHGVFETLRVIDGEPVFLDAHLQRLELGMKRLFIPDAGVIDAIRLDVAAIARDAPVDAIVKIIVTAGTGPRGYKPLKDSHPVRIVSCDPYHPRLLLAEQGIKVRLCATRLSINADLAGIKHLNRLEQVLAAAEIGDEFNEGLMLDTEGYLVEGIYSNLFLVLDGALVTPLLDRSGVEGIMRAKILEWAPATVVRRIVASELERATEAFMCNSVYGIHPITTLVVADQTQLLPRGPMTRALQEQLLAVSL